MDSTKAKRIAASYAQRNPKVTFLPPAVLGLVGTIVALMGWCFPVGPLMCVVSGVWTARIALASTWNKTTKRFRR